MKRPTTAATLLAAAILAGPLFVPEALAFPFHARVGAATVWSDSPIPPAIGGVVARADVLVQASPIAGPPTGRRIFLTDGGWRWRWLALGSGGAFALTRPLSEAVVVNRSDVAADRVFNGAAIAGRRTLSGVLAHERTHSLIRARYGLLAERMMPAWVREGYPDHVARESSLPDEQVAGLRRADPAAPALFYHDARARVAAALAANGGSLDRLVAQAR